MSEENENNLVQRREDRRTLAKMRSKLATSGQRGGNEFAKPKPPPKRGMRIWPFALVVAVILLGLNFVLRAEPEQIMSLMGRTKTEKTGMTPPAGASLDDQARFWAYAIYDFPKLKARFQVPRGVPIDKARARQNLEILLADNLGTEVRNEIFVYQDKAPPVSAGKKVGAVRKPGT